MYTIFTLLAIMSGLFVTGFTELIFEDIFPDLHTCSRTHWYMDECILISIESMKPYLKKGIPQLDINSIDPYYINNIEFHSSGGFNGCVTFNKTWFYGLTDFVVNDVNASDDLNVIELQVTFSRISIDAEPIIDGKLKNAPIMKTKYHIQEYYTNVKSNITISGAQFSRSNEKYFAVTNVSLTFEMERRTQINMTRINDYYYDLSREILLSAFEKKQLKRLWTTLKSDILNTIKNHTSTAIRELANKIYYAFPLTTLMPVFV